LDEATGAELLRLAEAARAESLDHFQFTRLIAAEYDLRRKMELATTMWGVILADGHLTDHEAHLVRKMASLMQLDPGSLAAARRAAERRRDGGEE
ncbi:MAG TPA: TerB family tellurite resistance protein, partial [Gemmatimonadales bacterium]|nr:TerB family tellurite resistance protein [Gemmatimonadales bacterium]